MSNDPWKDLKRPSSKEAVTARRVDPRHPWDFFWMRDAGNRCGLLLQCSVDSAESLDPPALHGISMGFIPDPNHAGKGALVIRLNEVENVDVFHALCLDIVAHASNATTEAKAVTAIVMRAWRWHYLLRKGRDSRLSIDEQKGLVGELLFLERVLIFHFGVDASVNAWNGPFGGAKDFVLGAVAVEIKACRNAGGPFVSISSEYQLDDSDLAALYLGVVDVSIGKEGQANSMTLTEIVAHVQSIVSAGSTDAVIPFATRLLAAGFRKEDHYSERWLASDVQLHRVKDDFPRLTTTMIPAALSKVRYHLPVPALRAYQADTAGFVEAIESQGD